MEVDIQGEAPRHKVSSLRAKACSHQVLHSMRHQKVREKAADKVSGLAVVLSVSAMLCLHALK